MHLTRPAIILAILTLTIGVLGLWGGESGSLPWWRLLGAALLIALTAEWLITRLRQIDVRVHGPAHFFLGRDETLRLEFDNPALRPLALRYVATVPAAFDGPQTTESVWLEPAARTQTDVPVRSMELGQHRFASLPVRVRGPLGLAWWSRRLRLEADLTVLPDTLSAGAQNAGSSASGASTESALGGAMELHHLRDYLPGDALNTIDWKATARTRKLITRVFNEDQHLEVMILIDAGRTGRTRIDDMNQFGHYVNLAARFAEYCIAGDDRVGLVAFADRPIVSLPPGRGIAAVQRLRRTLAGLSPAAVESDVLQAALHLRTLLRHRCLVVILTDLYERSSKSQLVQASRLLLPAHLPLIVGLMSEDVVDIAAAEAHDWLDPYRSLAARQYQQDVAANVARLVQLGANAMTARPAELDRKVMSRYDLLKAQRRI